MKAQEETGSPQSLVKAVRLENFNFFTDWLAPLHQLLMRRYPAGQFVYFQKPTVVLVVLNTSIPWRKED